MSVKVYVEGGGDHNHALQTQCRRGFAEYFKKAGLEGRLPSVVPSGSRKNTYDDFRTAFANVTTNEDLLLLVDSEAPAQQGGPWEHLKQRVGDGWDRPPGATDEQAHLMVQCMEAWFLADRNSLKSFYGKGFRSNAFPARSDLENVSKAGVMRVLSIATRGCKTKGEYSKGRHSFEILRQIDPAKVRASYYANRLLNTLDHRCKAE